jgi:ATP-binding cassette subfamily G (WHITE) protein 2 (PDR)
MVDNGCARRANAQDGPENAISPQNSQSLTGHVSNTSDTTESTVPTSSHSGDAQDAERSGSVDRDVDHHVLPGDRAILDHIASNISRTLSRQRSSRAMGDALERRDTVDDIAIDNPALNPNSADFDLYKWLRVFMRQLDKEEIKIKRAGIVLKNLSISGTGSALNVQKTVGSMLMSPFRVDEYLNFGSKPVKRILRTVDGVLKSGEMLIVLGRPGAGCSTLLKSMTGEMHGLAQSEDSTVHYNGIPQKQMLKEFKGEVIYNQEVDKHFPHLTVGQTLEHAAALRTPSRRVMGISREDFAKHIVQVVMAIYGLSSTYNTKVRTFFLKFKAGLFYNPSRADCYSIGGR